MKRAVELDNFRNGLECNSIIRCAGGVNLPVHAHVLRRESHLFDTMFNHSMDAKKQQMVDMSDQDAGDVRLLMETVYSGFMSSELSKDPDQVEHLLLLAEGLGFRTAADLMQQHLNRVTISVSVTHTATQTDAVPMAKLPVKVNLVRPIPRMGHVLKPLRANLPAIRVIRYHD